MTPCAVCFGSRDNNSGTFKVPASGSIITFKLTYLNGSVTCAPRFNSKWGCYHSAVSTHPMGTLITYSNGTRLLPKKEYLRGGRRCLKLYYRLPWATPNSQELVFDNFSFPLSVTTDQEFQVWFVEDLIYNCDSDNGQEKTCAEVYGLYV